MARILALHVREILPTSVEDRAILSYINMANTIVNTELATSGLSEATKFEIERWLTAHLIATTRERQGIKEKLGDAEVTYASVFGTGLDSTHYGQTVKMLDTTGTMGNIGKKRISMTAIQSFEE